MHEISNAPTVELAKFYKTLCYEKWEALGEGRIVKAHRAAWEDKNTTRPEANQLCLYPGGITFDQNSLERNNRSTKDYVDHHKSRAVDFMQKVKEMLEAISVLDDEFGSKLHKEVNTERFYTYSTNMMPGHHQPHGGPVVPMETMLVEESGDAYMARSSGALKMALQEARYAGKTKVKIDQSDARKVREYLGMNTTRKKLPLQRYKELLEAPVKTIKQIQKSCGNLKRTTKKGTEIVYPFDEVKQLAHMFVKLVPITDVPYLRAMYYRFENMGSMHPRMTLDEWIKLGTRKEGLMSCNCKWWMHKCMCGHAMADALTKGILRVPPSKDNREHRRGNNTINTEAPNKKHKAKGYGRG